MRIGCLQFSPQVADVDNNLNRADSVLSKADQAQLDGLDLLVLPALAFTGYNFRSLQHISPFLEHSGSGISSLWARTTALKYNATVIVGYPEKVDVTADWPASPEYYNSTIAVNGDGETVANYRKSFLYSVDETWALESRDGFFEEKLDGLGTTVLGIDMDLNPYKFEAPWDDFEFAFHVIDSRANLVVITMAWLTREDSRQFTQTANEPDMETVTYWVQRLDPIIRQDREKEIIVVICNRAGHEEDMVYAGTSMVLGIKDGEVCVYGLLGRGVKELLVVDTDNPPLAKLLHRPDDQQIFPSTEPSYENQDSESLMPSTASHLNLYAGVQALPGSIPLANQSVSEPWQDAMPQPVAATIVREPLSALSPGESLTAARRPRVSIPSVIHPSKEHTATPHPDRGRQPGGPPTRGGGSGSALEKLTATPSSGQTSEKYFWHPSHIIPNYTTAPTPAPPSFTSSLIKMPLSRPISLVGTDFGSNNSDIREDSMSAHLRLSQIAPVQYAISPHSDVFSGHSIKIGIAQDLRSAQIPKVSQAEQAIVHSIPETSPPALNVTQAQPHHVAAEPARQPGEPTQPSTEQPRATSRRGLHRTGDSSRHRTPLDISRVDAPSAKDVEGHVDRPRSNMFKQRGRDFDRTRSDTGAGIRSHSTSELLHHQTTANQPQDDDIIAVEELTVGGRRKMSLLSSEQYSGLVTKHSASRSRSSSLETGHHVEHARAQGRPATTDLASRPKGDAQSEFRGRSRVARFDPPPLPKPTPKPPAQVALASFGEDDSAFNVSPLEAPNNWRSPGRLYQRPNEDILAKFLSDMPARPDTRQSSGPDKTIYVSRTATHQPRPSPDCTDKSPSPPRNSGHDSVRQGTPRSRAVRQSIHVPHFGAPSRSNAELTTSQPPQDDIVPDLGQSTSRSKTGTPRASKPSRGRITIPATNSPRPLPKDLESRKSQHVAWEVITSPGSDSVISTITKSSSSSSRDYEPTTPKAMKLEPQLDELLRTDSNASTTSVSSLGSKSTNRS